MQEWGWVKEASAYGVILIIVVGMLKFFADRFKELIADYKEQGLAFKKTIDEHLDKQQEAFRELAEKISRMK